MAENNQENKKNESCYTNSGCKKVTDFSTKESSS